MCGPRFSQIWILKIIDVCIYFYVLLFLNSQALATTVVQMLLAAPKNSNSWTEKLLGVLCLVKDFLKKSYFICLVDVSGVCRIILPLTLELIYSFHVVKALSLREDSEGT